MRATTLIATSAGSALAAAAGAFGTDPDSSWYQRLDKPSWQPPPAAFPAVWTPLYATIAVAAAGGLDAGASPRERRSYRRALTVNLALNAGWSWVFWRARRPWLAAGEAAALAVSSVDLVRRTARRAPGWGAALVPYAGWSGFATVLTTELARRNARP